MINVYNSTPKVYYDNSRDFQLFGRIYEVLFNYIQSNVSQVTEYEINSSLIDLLLYTLGFNKDLNYSSIDLEGLASVFKYVVKNKGTKLAIETCIYLLLRSQQINENFKIEILNMENPWKNEVTSADDLYQVLLYLPTNSKDIIFLDNMFDYILPAGYIYQVYYTTFSEVKAEDTYGYTEEQTLFSGENTNDLFGGIKSSSKLNNDEYTYAQGKTLNVNSMINSSVYRTVESSPTPSSYSVTFTASGNWSSSSQGSIAIIDGQDTSGTELFYQNPANKLAYPITLSVSSGYCCILFCGPFIDPEEATSNDYTIVETQMIEYKGVYWYCHIATIDKDGTIDINIGDFDR